jgi:hypothetical protein
MPLTNAWTTLRPHRLQDKLWRTKKRFVAVVAGRGSGKTELARRRVVRFLSVRKPWPDPVYFYAMPTERQARRVAWKAIKLLVPPEWIDKINESEMSIRTKFGSTLYVYGMDKPQRAEGLQYDGGVIDESSDHKPDVFNLTFLPALSHRHGWCWRIGVPKRHGSGAEDFKKFFDKGLSGEDPDLESYTWPSSTVLTPEELRFARANLDEKDFNEQFGGIWEKPGGLIFYGFGEENVDPNAIYNPAQSLFVGSDFNVSPMAWVICHRVKEELYVFDEIWMKDTNTPAALDELYRRYSSHKSGWNFFGDATGRARKTAAYGAAQSDYAHIVNDKRFKGAGIWYNKSNPSVIDRFASTNARLKSADGTRHVHINPKCENLIRDLMVRSYKQGSRDPDDSGDVGHITDALGYLVHKCWPATSVINKVSEQVGIVKAA